MLLSSQGQQYVCAGELVTLQTMTNVLNYLKIKKIDVQQVRVICVVFCLQAEAKYGIAGREIL